MGAAMPLYRHDALLLQLHERLADRTPAHLQAVGDVGFVEMIAKVERATKNGLPDTVGDLVGQATPLGRPDTLNPFSHRAAILTRC
jgi:hypothetical protein